MWYLSGGGDGKREPVGMEEWDWRWKSVEWKGKNTLMKNNISGKKNRLGVQIIELVTLDYKLGFPDCKLWNHYLTATIVWKFLPRPPFEENERLGIS